MTLPILRSGKEFITHFISHVGRHHQYSTYASERVRDCAVLFIGNVRTHHSFCGNLTHPHRRTPVAGVSLGPASFPLWQCLQHGKQNASRMSSVTWSPHVYIFFSWYLSALGVFSSFSRWHIYGLIDLHLFLASRFGISCRHIGPHKCFSSFRAP